MNKSSVGRPGGTSPMFFRTVPVDPTRRATVSEVKNNLARTLDDASRGTETVVTRHRRTVAVIVPPSAHRALRNLRRAVEQAFESSLRSLAQIRGNRTRGSRVPSLEVIALMEGLLRDLQGVLDVGPDRTVATAEGGVDTYFFSAERADDSSPARYVGLCVDCDGAVSALFSDGPGANAEELSPETDARELAARITDFLSGDPPEPA